MVNLVHSNELECFELSSKRGTLALWQATLHLGSELCRSMGSGERRPARLDMVKASRDVLALYGGCQICWSQCFTLGSARSDLKGSTGPFGLRHRSLPHAFGCVAAWAGGEDDGAGAVQKHAVVDMRVHGPCENLAFHIATEADVV